MSVLVSLRIWSSLNSGVDTLTLENLSTIIIFYSYKFILNNQTLNYILFSDIMRKSKDDFTLTEFSES